MLKIIRWANKVCCRAGVEVGCIEHLRMLCQLQFGACGKTDIQICIGPDPTCSQP